MQRHNNKWDEVKGATWNKLKVILKHFEAFSMEKPPCNQSETIKCAQINFCVYVCISTTNNMAEETYRTQNHSNKQSGKSK